LRAGLLSDPKVIARLNAQFVCTLIIIDDLEKHAARGDALAKLLAAQWEYPVEMMFARPDGTVIAKLNSFKDFPGMHPDVAAPPGKRHRAFNDDHVHRDHFLKHLAAHFDKE
jgi:hypothetical protein